MRLEINSTEKGIDFFAPYLVSDDLNSCRGNLIKRSSRAQARTTLGREFPIFTLSIAKRVPSPALAHVSCALSKIPYVGFSPIRLQAEASYDQPYPSRQPYKIKRHVRILPHGSRFDRAFVVLMPSCLNGGHYQHHQPQAAWTTTSAHGSFAPKGLCCPFPHRSYDPIRQSRRLPPISHSLVIRRVFAR